MINQIYRICSNIPVAGSALHPTKNWLGYLRGEYIGEAELFYQCLEV